MSSCRATNANVDAMRRMEAMTTAAYERFVADFEAFLVRAAGQLAADEFRRSG